MSEALSITVMGQFAIRLHGESQAIKSLPRRKVRSLLKLLALEPSHALTRDTLIEHLWADLDPTAAAAQLYNALYNLRKALGDLVAPKLVSGVVRLEPTGGLSVDVSDFMALAREGIAQKDTAKLLEAANFIDGQPMSEDLYEDWAETYRQELLGLQTQVLATLANLDTAHAELAWKKYLELEPVSEIAQLGLIRYYAAQGANHLALEQFERYRLILAEELSAEPSQEAKEIIGNLVKPSPVKTIRPPLPAPTVPLVGREAELTVLHGFFADSDWRLLTILGIGGNGKTRLALEAAWTWQNNFVDGAYWVSFENISQTDDPSQSVLLALGLTPPNSQAETVLLDYLRDKQCLLVLDNLEHLPDIRHWVQRLLSAAAKIKLLATSRSVLQLQSERVLELSGLNFEAAKTLFIQSATRVKAGFYQDTKIELQIGVLTEHLAGSPLAIELAASWIRHMSLEEIAAEVQLDLDFLERPVKDRNTRHHSVRAVFDSSWRLLGGAEQQTLVSLAVFIGEFSLASARAVSGATRAAIVALTDRSLLRLTETRLELHPLLRQFVLEQAAQNPERLGQTRQAHAAHYFELLQALPIRYRTQDLEAYLDTKRHVDLIYQNARAAWAWTLEKQQFEALSIALEGLTLLHILGNRFNELSALLTHSDLPPELAAQFALQRGYAKVILGLFQESEAEFVSALPELLTNQQNLNRLRHFSLLFARTARAPKALEYAEQAVDLSKNNPDFFEQTLSYVQLSDVLSILGKLEEAQSALESARSGANIRVLSLIPVHAAILAGRKGEYERAEIELREAQTLLIQLDDRRNLQSVNNNLATALQFQGKYLESRLIFETSVKEARFLGDQRMLTALCNGQLDNLRALGQYQEALHIGNENLALCQRLGNTLRAVHCILRIGHLSFELGQLTQALKQYQTALDLEVVETKEEIIVSLIRGYLQAQQIESAQALLESIKFKSRAFIPWAAVLTIIIQQKSGKIILLTHLKPIFESLQNTAALNACECLVSLLEPMAQLNPIFAKRLAMSLVQDQRSSFYVQKLARVFVGNTTLTPELPWKSLIKEF
jgi:DNA-binding SARP family transcriptional activator/predicted ATPase